MNTMKLAHELRRSLNIEGCYRVQMRACLALAWKVKKGEVAMEQALTGDVMIFEEAKEKEVVEPIKDIVTLDDIIKTYSAKRYVAYPTDNSIPQNNHS